MRSTKRQRGQALTEYIVIVAFAMVVLWLPVFPNPDTGERTSLLILMLKVLDIYMNSFHNVISLPIP